MNPILGIAGLYSLLLVFLFTNGVSVYGLLGEKSRLF